MAESRGAVGGHPRGERSLERLQTCRGGALSSAFHAPQEAVQQAPRWPSGGVTFTGRSQLEDVQEVSGRSLGSTGQTHAHAAWGRAGGRGAETDGCKEVAFLTHSQVAPKPQAIENHIWSRRL